jgi:shikimate dehydrogenase
MSPNKLTGTTRVLAVIGDPISHSLSPIMHNSMCISNKLNYIYVPLQVYPKNLLNAIQGVKALNIAGFNVTIPHKETVIEYLDQLDFSAKQINAVNTVVNENGKLIGHNTDGDGFLISLASELNLSITNQHVVILGAGGASKSIAYSIAQSQPKSMTFINRTIEKAYQLATQYNGKAVSNASDLSAYLSRADLVINTTSIGMDGISSPLTSYEWVNNRQTIIDIIYTPRETPFLKQCRLGGATTLNGIGMLAGQGVKAFQLFTKHPASYTEFKTHLESYLSPPS